ncbi:metal ABC transporter solute-binding protein, Zn/Mn family [Ancylomarina longa]|nr:zinc ABC transporter substrate-binding protein [Ancylomarina longa]
MEKKENVLTVSILPQKFFIEQIAGDDFHVNVLIPPGASPATYEPTPLQMTKISHSMAYFRIGHIPFEEAWCDKIIESAGDIKVFDLSGDVKLIKNQGHHHGDHFHEEGIDPHIWSSPKTVEKIVQRLYLDLVQLKPNNQKKYEANLNIFLGKIRDLDILATKEFNGENMKAFMIFHPALSYLARDYGLKQIPIEMEGKEPSPAYMQHLVMEAREYNIKTIFIQKQFNKENAETLAREIGAKVVAIDPLSENWLMEMENIIRQLNGNGNVKNSEL